jgi:hypothetical protein
MIGHWKPIFHRFKGGQCVGTAVGIFLFIIPIEFFISLVFGVVLVLLVVRRLVEKWVRWIPLTFIILVPLIAMLLNAPLEVPLFTHLSLGGHPWYWIAGIGVAAIDDRSMSFMRCVRVIAVSGIANALDANVGTTKRAIRIAILRTILSALNCDLRSLPLHTL